MTASIAFKQDILFRLFVGRFILIYNVFPMKIDIMALPVKRKTE